MNNVLVTGASRGLGLVIARRLAASGYRVVAVARTRTDEVASAIDAAAASSLGAIEFEPFDLADIAGIADFVKTVRRRHGPIYGLVNNAAIGASGPLATMQNGKIEELVRLNTMSPMILTKFVVRGMMAEGAGRIVNVSSIIATTGFSGLSVYGGTKASMIGFTRSLAREVGRTGVNVNAVAPGFMATDMTRGIDENQLGQIARRSALRELPSIDDVAGAVVFLMGDAARSITGTVLTVDSGATA
jgi:3-oxoacyl-[acyl-carrier protein] reductase